MIKNSDIVDVSKLYMNDIHCMSANFGIEAAVKVLINVSINNDIFWIIYQFFDTIKHF